MKPQVIRCQNGHYRIGAGPCVFTSRSAAQSASDMLDLLSDSPMDTTESLESVRHRPFPPGTNRRPLRRRAVSKDV